MPYGDEENITARRAAQLRSKLDISKEVEIGEHIYSFKTRLFPDLKFSMERRNKWRNLQGMPLF